jgi:hypothetical protein
MYMDAMGYEWDIMIIFGYNHGYSIYILDIECGYLEKNIIRYYQDYLIGYYFGYITWI